MLDHLLDRIREVEEVDAVHVVTNHKFADCVRRLGVERGTSSSTTTARRARTIASARSATSRFVVDRAGLDDDDLLVIAGDNLFDYSLEDYVQWWQGKGEASAVVLYDVGDLELVKQYSNVEVDEDERLVSFVEKPEQPTSTLVATASYLYHRAHVPLLRRYLDEGNPPDHPGRLVAWLVPRAPVYGYSAGGDWRDIGDAGQLLEADNRLRALAGLPLRTAYSLD